MGALIFGSREIARPLFGGVGVDKVVNSIVGSGGVSNGYARGRCGILHQMRPGTLFAARLNDAWVRRDGSSQSNLTKVERGSDECPGRKWVYQERA